MNKQLSSCTYDAIQAEAESFASIYRSTKDIQELPSKEELLPYKLIIDEIYPNVVIAIKDRLSRVESEGGHGYEHLEWVACLSGYIANIEVQNKSTENQLKL
jgi:hypothetical protein